LFWRSVLRGIGETGAAPAGIKAIIGASASALGGDISEAEQVFEAAISPYVASNETYKKRGFWVAAQEFIPRSAC
jgi:ABC-type molybdenum transport system ATPase subunit/photorepair protein PhrA